MYQTKQWLPVLGAKMQMQRGMAGDGGNNPCDCQIPQNTCEDERTEGDLNRP